MKESYLLDTSSFSKESLFECAAQLWKALLPMVAYLNEEELKVLENAFNWMVISHDQQLRKNGEYYITHPVAATYILACLGMDKDSLCACLMHDVPEDTSTTLKDLSVEFDPSVIFLIESVTKLSTIKYKGEDRYAENLRRMFIAMSQDLRVVIIKMADRLHNLHTLGSLPEPKRKRIAQESMEIYAPLAERLGISFFRGEIEDCCFKHLHPEEYQKLMVDVLLQIDQRMIVVNEVKNSIKTILTNNNIEFSAVSGRAKKYYSTWCKMKLKSYTLDKIDDLIAIRVIVKSVEDCYSVLSLVHNLFEPKEDRMKDYIAMPKPNGYQSLHTTVQEPISGQIFEIQIRTEAMHAFAEYGVASHWNYKAKNDSMSKLLSNESFKWISELVDLGNQNWSQEEYLKHVKLDIFNDRIFVLTPKQDAIDLPAGGTALDFAFRIHYDIGCHAYLAKINGKVAKLGDVLANGDVIEILVDKKQEPKRDWLNIVKTTNASKHIRAYLRKHNLG